MRKKIICLVLCSTVLMGMSFSFADKEKKPPKKDLPRLYSTERPFILYED